MVIEHRQARFAQAAGTRDVYERRRRLVRAAWATIETLRLGSELDELFCSAFRDSLLTEGATDSDIDAVAEFHASLVVEYSTDRAIRDEQLEAIAQRLACTSMIFHVAHLVDGGSMLTRVDFPTRPKVQ